MNEVVEPLRTLKLSLRLVFGAVSCDHAIFWSIKKGYLIFYLITDQIIVSSYTMRVFILIEHHHYRDFPAVFTQLLWLISLGVSRDSEIN